MPTATSRLTSKYQATIPGIVRKELGLHAGDAISFEIEDGEIRLHKALPLDLAFTHAVEGTLSEWESDTDEEAYREL
ncbi:AbrB/MazE/SpoVT family DNA-binding domain-containing protein [Halomonas sp. TRM85114]|uniref:AbrB/MazE/SpoVT family DNA-binding domain-containing protein n=1 Tax=Halomonas jincaotanensis TaxID=2810616 RepID=UPI001BD4FDA5|nr:AbrB/MazE/SpoVT family DNA-binding domain-containing protein [Halomonas jincaotanensis]MBS9403516.1 AbrB/MazE/SpoVT family DNA-binding domain-containing protein [Halomonas jincaotanensis]